MYTRKIKKEIRCPIEHGLEILGGKWRCRIICVLAAKETLRYGELRAEMANISDTVLAATLKELIANGMGSAQAIRRNSAKSGIYADRPGENGRTFVAGYCRVGKRIHKNQTEIARPLRKL